MLRVIFTLDYEIHGNGEGCPYALMVEPTERMMRQFEAYGAKLTILADIGEILKFKEYADQRGRDDYHYGKIAAQLKDAIRRGHDVQLHIHSSYFKARHENGRWMQDWSEYNFAGLSLDRLREIIRIGKQYLESLIRPEHPAYECNVFRAANWSVSPSRNVIRALVDNGIKIDTSVFKYGRRQGLVSFDYSQAWSNLAPWYADENDISARSEKGQLLECPIYSENRWLGAFLTPHRIYRACVSRLHRFNGALNGAPSSSPNGRPQLVVGAKKSHPLFSLHAWKADFNQCTGHQLVQALQRAERDHQAAAADLPFVLIGHSKLFTRFNQWSLRSFLAHVAKLPERYQFGRFAEVRREG